VSDIDSSIERLLRADLVDAIGKPVVNHPGKVLRTGWEQLSRILEHIPGCCVPARCSGAPCLRQQAVRAFPPVLL